MLVGLADRAECRQLWIPQRTALLVQRDAGDQRDGQNGPTQRLKPLEAAFESLAERRQVATPDCFTGQLRQHETRHQRRRQHPGQRIQAELGQPGKAREKQGGKAGNRGQHAEPDGRPEAFAPGIDTHPAGLHEVVDRVIDRLADQRRAEADGDTEDRAVGQADRDNAGQCAGDDGQQAEREQPERAIDEEQHGNDRHAADQRQLAHLVLDRCPRIDREQAGPGERQAGLAQAARRAALGELLANQLDGGFLPVGIGAEGAGLDQQHGAFAIARGPDAGAAVRLGAGIELAENGDQFTGRVAGEQRLEHHAGRRGQQVDAVGDGLFQTIGRETFRRDLRTEQVAVLEQEIAVGRLAVAFAVLDRGEFGPLDEPAAQVARQRRPLGDIAAADRDHEQPGNGPFLELIDQHLLFRCRLGRQEKRHVGREPAVPDDGRPGQHGQQPEQEGAAGGRLHRLSIGSMLITERSPSACRYSMLRIWFLLPLTMMRWTMAAIFWSLGSSVSVHFSALPARNSA